MGEKQNIKVLFVCTGNVCRSFVAQKLLANLQAKNPPAFLEVKSCGVAAESYFKVPKQAASFLKSQGIESFKHTPKYITEELIDWADFIFAMESWQHDIISDKFPQSLNKMYLLLKYCSDEKDKDFNIYDPMGKSDKYFVQIFSLINDCVIKLFEKLKKQISVSL